MDESVGQLLLYHELVRDLLPRKRSRLQFAILTKAKQNAVDLHVVRVDVKQIDRTKRIVERAWKAIDAQVFYTSPSAMTCSGCSFRAPCREW